MADSELIAGIIQGNNDSFRLLVEKYQDMIFRTCYGYVKSVEDAEDITQNVFILVHRNMQKFRGDSSLSTWLYRIAINQSINHLRQSKWKKWVNQVENLFGDEKIKSIPDFENPSDSLIEKQKVEILNKAIDSLQKNQKTAFVLHKYDDLSHQQIAEIMDISISAVESLIFRAKRNLQKTLIKYYDEFFY